MLKAFYMPVAKYKLQNQDDTFSSIVQIEQNEIVI